MNHPFREIDDIDTKKWFRRADFTFEIPDDSIDEYSELDSSVLSDGFIVGEFEPRESVKGDIARAVFYFYTMYTEEALEADSDYFAEMQSDLCQWHVMDPADDLEIRNTNLIAVVQDDSPNPFVLDCTLAIRAYCPEIEASCSNQTVATIETAESASISLFPNPTTSSFEIVSPIKIARVELYNSIGKKVLSKSYSNEAIGLGSLPSGLYEVLLHSDKNVFSSRLKVIR